MVYRVLFPRKNNFSHVNKFYIAPIWFIENIVEKHWADAVINHMLGRKKRNSLIPYSELVIKILVQISYDLEEEQSEIRHSEIGKCTLS